MEEDEGEDVAEQTVNMKIVNRENGSDDLVVKQPLSITMVTENKKQMEELPVGLVELKDLDQVLVHQHLEAGDMCFQRPCRYSIYPENSDDSILYVEEASQCYARQCLGALRNFKLKFRNSVGQDVMRLLRPLRCPCGICWWWCCCVQEMTIESPPGTPIGKITERRLMCCPKYIITDDHDDEVFSIQFSCCLCKLCSDVSIPIYENKSGDMVGEITKTTKGSGKECCGTQNDFNIHFLKPLDIQDKLLVLGASFLVDFNFFEGQQRSCC